MSVSELEAGLRHLVESLYSAELTQERKRNYRRQLKNVPKREGQLLEGVHT